MPNTQNLNIHISVQIGDFKGELTVRFTKFGLVALALALAGCGPEPSSSPAATNPSPGPAPTTSAAAPAAVKQADLDAIPKASKPYKIVLIVKTKNNQFFIP